MFGKYKGWEIVIVLFLAKNSQTNNELPADALSWCKSHEWFRHKSVRFFGSLRVNGVELVGNNPC